ncbi:MAG: glycosyltransferase family 2 protein, partial [Candidatus Levyibacteriota bacterium]
WDEDYFFYGEDIDFCYRIKKMGLKIFFVPEYKAIHHKGLSSGIKKVSAEASKATLDTKIWATNHRFKAMEIFYNKHYKKKYPWIITKAVLLAIKLKHAMTLKNLQK